MGACGTAVVLTPVNRIVFQDKVAVIGDPATPNATGPVMQKLYSRIRRIQNGEEPDKFNWMIEI